MLRAPVDEAEALAALSRLSEARELMIQALNLLDETPVATDCDCHLDQAIHNLSQTMTDVQGGASIFIDRSRTDFSGDGAERQNEEAIEIRLAHGDQGEPFA